MACVANTEVCLLGVVQVLSRHYEIRTKQHEQRMQVLCRKEEARSVASEHLMLGCRSRGRGGGGSTTLADATELHSAAGAVGEGAVRNDNALGSVVGACRNALSVSVVFVPSLSWQNPRFSAAKKGAKKGGNQGAGRV